MDTETTEFAQFMVASWPSLNRFAYLLCGNVPDAEELAQAALVRAYLSWGTIQRKASAESFARTCMVRVHLNERRRLGRDRRAVQRLASHPTESAGTPESDELWVCLTRLPPRQRTVLVLRYYEGLSEREIAEVMGISTGTVKSQASKALGALRTYVYAQGALTDSEGSEGHG